MTIGDAAVDHLVNKGGDALASLLREVLAERGLAVVRVANLKAIGEDNIRLSGIAAAAERAVAAQHTSREAEMWGELVEVVAAYREER